MHVAARRAPPPVQERPPNRFGRRTCFSSSLMVGSSLSYISRWMLVTRLGGAGARRVEAARGGKQGVQRARRPLHWCTSQAEKGVPPGQASAAQCSCWSWFHSLKRGRAPTRDEQQRVLSATAAAVAPMRRPCAPGLLYRGGADMDGCDVLAYECVRVLLQGAPASDATMA